MREIQINSFMVFDWKPFSQFFYEINKMAYLKMFESFLGKEILLHEVIEIEKESGKKYKLKVNAKYNTQLKNKIKAIDLRYMKQADKTIFSLREKIYDAFFDKNKYPKDLKTCLADYLAYKYIFETYISECRSQEYFVLLKSIDYSLIPYNYFFVDFKFRQMLIKIKYGYLPKQKCYSDKIKEFYLKTKPLFKAPIKHENEFYSKIMILSEEEDFLIMGIYGTYFFEEDC